MLQWPSDEPAPSTVLLTARHPALYGFFQEVVKSGGAIFAFQRTKVKVRGTANIIGVITSFWGHLERVTALCGEVDRLQ